MLSPVPGIAAGTGIAANRLLWAGWPFVACREAATAMTGTRDTVRAGCEAERAPLGHGKKPSRRPPSNRTRPPR